MSVVYLDVDGVLADFISPACRFHGIPDFFNEFPRCRGASHWNFFKRYGITTMSFLNSLDRGFWRDLPKTPEADSIVELLELDIVVVTSPPASPVEFCHGRTEWIRRNYKQFLGRMCFVQRKAVLAGPGKILIDDNQRNVELFRKAGGRAILVPRPWNDAWRHEGRIVTRIKRELERI